MKNRLLACAVLSLVLCSFIISCGARRERAELIEFAKLVETNRQQGVALIDKFFSTQGLQGNKDMKSAAEKLAQTAVEINEYIAPFQKMKIKSKELSKIREEYVTIYTSLLEMIRMTLEVMVSRDPRLGASLNDRLLKATAQHQNSMQRFSADYDNIMIRYSVTPEELGLPPPTPQPATPPGPFLSQPTTPQPGAMSK